MILRKHKIYLFTLSKSEQYSFVDEVFKDVLLAHVIKQSFYEQLLPLAILQNNINVPCKKEASTTVIEKQSILEF